LTDVEFFFQNRFNKDGIIPPFGLDRTIDSSLKPMMEMYTCVGLVYSQVLAILFQKPIKFPPDESENNELPPPPSPFPSMAFHYNQLTIFSKWKDGSNKRSFSLSNYYQHIQETSFNSGITPTIDASLDLFTECTKMFPLDHNAFPRLVLKVPLSSLRTFVDTKYSFAQEFNKQYNSTYSDVGEEGLIDNPILFVSMSDNLSIPLNCNGFAFDSIPLAVTITSTIQCHYRLVAVLYYTDQLKDKPIGQCSFFRVIGTSPLINDNVFTTFDVQPSKISLYEEQQFPPIKRMKPTKQGIVLFPPMFSKCATQYYALGSYWVKVEDYPMTMVADLEKEGIKHKVLTPKNFLIYANNEITSNSVADMRDKGWLDGPVLNVLIHKAMRSFNSTSIRTKRYNHIFMNDSVFLVLKESGRTPFIKEWSEEFYKDGKSFFDDNNVVHILINHESMHWIYGVISMKFRTIMLLDSMDYKKRTCKMQDPRDELEQVLRDYIGLELEDHHPNTSLNWNVRAKVNCPKQNDNDSCGVYLILNALRVMRILEYTDSTTHVTEKDVEWSTVFRKKEDIEPIRNSMAAVVIGKEDIKNLIPYTKSNAGSGKPKKVARR